MSTVLEETDIGQLEKDLAETYRTATQAETAVRKARSKAAVASHRLGTIANQLQPLIEASEGTGMWGAYLQRHGMAPRTVQRAQRLARCLDEATCATMSLEEADDASAEKEAVQRGNVGSVEEYRKLKDRLAKARKALDMQEAERKKDHPAVTQGRDKDQPSVAAKTVRQMEVEGQPKPKEIGASPVSMETAGPPKAEEATTERASIPMPRTEASTMPSQVVAAMDEPEANDHLAPEEDYDLLDDERLAWLMKRLREIVSERPNDLTDARDEPSVQSAVDALLSTCNGDAEVAFGVVAIWFVNSGL